MAWILSYGCTSAAGLSSEELWAGLCVGTDFSKPSSFIPEVSSYEHPDKNESNQESMLSKYIHISWQQAFSKLSYSSKMRIQNSKELGIIFASTKGFIDDVIWNTDRAPKEDTLSPLLSNFILKSELKFKKQTCISNACSSSLAALYLAKKWIDSNAVEDVLVISADAVGLFVLKGFQSLRVLTKDKTRPFSQGRTGFYLGEATAAILLSKHKEENSFLLKGVGIDSEGYAVTRPSQSGDSLKRAIEKASNNLSVKPDVILAHATSTPVNDAVEDQVFNDLYWKNNWRPSITASKWCTGHTLAVSGALDVITSCEILKNQKIFSIANTEVKDFNFKCDYTLANTPLEKLNVQAQRVLVTSLGFGGLHGAAIIEKATDHTI